MDTGISKNIAQDGVGAAPNYGNQISVGYDYSLCARMIAGVDVLSPTIIWGEDGVKCVLFTQYIKVVELSLNAPMVMCERDGIIYLSLGKVLKEVRLMDAISQLASIHVPTLCAPIDIDVEKKEVRKYTHMVRQNEVQDILVSAALQLFYKAVKINIQNKALFRAAEKLKPAIAKLSEKIEGLRERERKARIAQGELVIASLSPAERYVFDVAKILEPNTILHTDPANVFGKWNALGIPIAPRGIVRSFAFNKAVAC